VPRKLSPNQTCQVWVHDTKTNRNHMVLEVDHILLEAPNWSRDGEALIVNGNGVLWRIALQNPTLDPIIITGVPPLNNDHVLDPDGEHIFLSAYDDWQMYRAPLKGGVAQKVTYPDTHPGLMHFLHGVSPDGKQLAFVGLRRDETQTPPVMLSAEIYTIDADGKDYQQITHANVPADGPEYSPDGQWLYFNTEAFSGHAQIACMRTDGTEMTQIVSSETVDWFPHISPDAKQIAYLAYPPGTQGHPADLNVELMLMNEHGRRSVAKLFGGQGTINVNSWSPDSKQFAYVAYPLKTS
jgi:Tol biopolymer transport system component